jgi:hypothetical protein
LRLTRTCGVSAQPAFFLSIRAASLRESFNLILISAAVTMR